MWDVEPKNNENFTINQISLNIVVLLPEAHRLFRISEHTVSKLAEFFSYLISLVGNRKEVLPI